MDEIITQLIELINIGVAGFVVVAGVCLLLLAAAIVMHLLGVRAVEARRRPTRPRAAGARSSRPARAARVSRVARIEPTRQPVAS